MHHFLANHPGPRYQYDDPLRESEDLAELWRDLGTGD
jgi:hypothetical protein